MALRYPAGIPKNAVRKHKQFSYYNFNYITKKYDD